MYDAAVGREVGESQWADGGWYGEGGIKFWGLVLSVRLTLYVYSQPTNQFPRGPSTLNLLGKVLMVRVLCNNATIRYYVRHMC